ncbi:hypothetical protein [Sedimentibacter sp. MB31-C6]|jgi:hypothetical protein|uniref:hypothetical protein n=1 Tax=Sedimentibacter sp. MB31-C6 TaxID=3109366 RepID=UPI002DDCCB90|nr:hypothetical protein [Sedimentibacter sp. MB36-C1]WSI03144.1 hypothetical protein U8307_08825 [Sedimentibacter sp. MB36-C1]
MVNSQEGLTLRIYLTSEKEQDIYPDSIIGFYNLTVYMNLFYNTIGQPSELYWRNIRWIIN